MDINQDTINLIKKWEGCKLQSYQDTGGVWTIGYGHTENVVKGMVISQDLADTYFTQDINKFANGVSKLITVPVNDNQFGACISLAYNIGLNAFKDSTLLKKLNNKDYQGAANEFPKWCHDNGKVIKGLVNRREDERKLFLKPTQKTVQSDSNTSGTSIPIPSKNAVSGLLFKKIIKFILSLFVKNK